MGFFSGLLGGKKQTVPASGFFSQPAEYQNLYKSVLNNANTTLPQINSQMFTPQAITAGEQGAINAINTGFTPTQESISSDVAMQMNPFDQYVIDAINREAAGQNSILQQNLQGAGQSGSNRQLLGANDIDLTRLQQIGGFKQGQYNTALNNALTTMTSNRRQDAASQLGVGDFLRQLDLQTKQAPLSAATAQKSLLSGVPVEFGTNSEARTIKTGGGLMGFLGSPLGGAATDFAGGFAQGIAPYLGFSDSRMKENIVKVGEKNGYNIYEFNYVGDDKKYTGVMAEEVEAINPEAVSEFEGYKMVDYGKIGVNMEEA